MEHRDDIMIAKTQKGDVEAFESLVSAYHKKVFNIALRITGNYDDASDLAQEVFIKVFKSIKDFKGKSSFSTWIYRVTVNVCMDSLRKLKRHKVVHIDEDIMTEDGDIRKEIADESPGPEILAEKRELRKAVSEAINLLHEDHRIVLVLRDIQDFSYDEISQFLDLPQGTVKSRINRARQALRDILSEKKELWEAGYVKYNGKEGLV